jgi:chromate transporter
METEIMPHLQPLIDVITVFSELSIMALGGGIAVIAQMNNYAVSQYHWMTDKQFVDVFAITQSTPGPSMQIVAVIGYKAAGWPGAAAALVAMFAPACLITWAVAQAWHKFHGSPWREHIERGLSAVTVGLIFASALIVTQKSAHDWRQLTVVVASAFILSFTKINPLYIMGIAGVLGYLQIV